MPTRRALTGVLHGFLGAFTSRYSAYQGYWLFGFLLPYLTIPETQLEMDLLAENAQPITPEGFAARRAATIFVDQLRKASFEREHVQQARLIIRRLANECERMADYQFRIGYFVRFEVTVTADTGYKCERAQVEFVAPHDPNRESKTAT